MASSPPSEADGGPASRPPSRYAAHFTAARAARSAPGHRAVLFNPPPRADPPEGAIPAALDAAPHHATMARLHDSLVSQEQLKRENQTLRGKLKGLEEELAESRRVISAQLSKLATARAAAAALRQAEGDLKAQLERSKRHARAMESHHREELKNLHTQFERAKAFDEAQIADLQARLEVGRNQPRTRPIPPNPIPGHTSDSSPVLAPAPPDLTPPAEPRGPEADCDDAPHLSTSTSHVELVPVNSTTSAAHLAEQLKAWLFHELAEGFPKPEAADSNSTSELNIETKDPPNAENKTDTAGTFAVNPQALLEAVILSKQYAIQKPSDPDSPEVEDFKSCHSQTSPLEQTQSGWQNKDFAF
ncbi:unnamed protein product [Phytomonas sp. Hart1]|nr:unnamed protein product [Phytomonas sp. Hart1]|eukprot:CCW69772.1 unnamed protein product [Phytomonas sp. isolate Hart1]